MKKRLTKIIVLFCITIISMTSIAFAAKTPVIEYNGKIVKTDVSPFISENRTFVPLRFIAETLGKKVEWNGEKRIVTVTEDTFSIKLTINNKKALVDNKLLLMDVAPLIKENRTFVPLRFVAENLNADIKWDANNFKVIINDKSQKLNLNNEEQKYIDELSSLQKDLAASISKLKSSFFQNAANLNESELLDAYNRAEKEIDDLSNKVKNLNVPDKFKEAHEYTIKANEKAKEILPIFKDSIINENEDAAKKLIRELTDFQVKIEESKDSLNAAIKGEIYKAQKDIKVYKDEKAKQESTDNLLEDANLKGLLDRL